MECSQAAPGAKCGAVPSACSRRRHGRPARKCLTSAKRNRLGRNRAGAREAFVIFAATKDAFEKVRTVKRARTQRKRGRGLENSVILVMVSDSENHASPVEHCDTIVLPGSDTREAKCQTQEPWINISQRDFSRLPICAEALHSSQLLNCRKMFHRSLTALTHAGCGRGASVSSFWLS